MIRKEKGNETFWQPLEKIATLFKKLKLTTTVKQQIAAIFILQISVSVN